MSWVSQKFVADHPHTLLRNKGESKPVTHEVAGLDEQDRTKRFDKFFVEHLNAAYNLARRLTRDDNHAEDVVQEACLRAFKFLDSFHGGNGRAWLLTIVRNTYYTWLEKNRSQMLNVPFDEDSLAADGYEVNALTVDASYSVDRSLEMEDNKRLVNRVLDRLPTDLCEVIVLRELEDMSYKEIAAIANIPIGTVMSRLARARNILQKHLQYAKLES